MRREDWEVQVKDAAQEVANAQWRLDQAKVAFATAVLNKMVNNPNGRSVDDLDDLKEFEAVQKDSRALETAEKRLITLAKVPQ